MKADEPGLNGYDPTWRSFEGRTEFLGHPSSLQNAPAMDRAATYEARPPSAATSPRRKPMFSGAAKGLVPAVIAAPLTEPSPEALQDEARIADHNAAPGLEPEYHPAAETPAPEWPQAVPEGPVILPEPHSPIDPVQASGSPPREPASPAPLAFQTRAPLPTLPAAELAALYGNGINAREARSARIKPPRSRAKRVVAVAVLVGAAALAGIGFIVIPKMLAIPETVQAQFTAPMLVLRAAASGAVTNVAVAVGQAVEPKTVLLTIRTDQPSDPGLADLQARPSPAQIRLGTLGDAASAGRQRDAPAGEVNTPQKVASSTGGVEDRPVVAGVRGVVWSLNTQTGVHLQAGDPLIQLADCGRAFMVVQDAASHFKAGQTILITMQGLRPFHGTVRASSGLAEPANTLVIEPTGFAAVSGNACPVGATAQVQMGTRS